MHFLDESGNPIKNCSSCNADFSFRKSIFDQANCAFTCPAKQLEMEHEEVTKKMISHCLPKEKVIFLSPKHISATNNDVGWGETDDIRKAIKIPWYTLRSKKEFFDTMAHELGHITAYKKLFNFSERKVIYNFDNLRLRNKIFSSRLLEAKLRWYYAKHKKLIDRYVFWDNNGHDYNPWYKEYLKFHKKLINSPFKKYAYGNTEPRDYGFNKDGQGEYKPKHN